MLVEVTKTTTQKEMVDIELPAYYKSAYRVLKFTETHIIEAGDDILISWDKDSDKYKSVIGDAVNLQPATETDFTTAFNNFLNKINPLVNGTISELELSEG